MNLLATDYNNFKTYIIRINSGSINGLSIILYNSLDQKIDNIKFINIEFRDVSESCTAKVTYCDNSVQDLTITGICDG